MLHRSEASMAKHHWIHVTVVALCCSLLGAAPCGAQNGFGAKPGGGFQGAAAAGGLGGRSILHVDGTVKAVSRLGLTVTDQEGTEIMVQLPQDLSKVQFRADADPRGLRPGMMVRFQAALGPGGVPLEPVKQVEIFHPIRMPKMPRRVAESMTPGLHSDNKQPANRNVGFVPGKYRVVGALAGGDPSSWLAVTAGKYPIRVQMAPEAKFVIRTHSLELAQPGDRVSLDGFYNEPDKTRVLADKLTITADRVIGTPTEEPAGPRRGRARRGRGAAVEGEGAAAAEAGVAAEEGFGAAAEQ